MIRPEGRRRPPRRAAQRMAFGADVIHSRAHSRRRACADRRMSAAVAFEKHVLHGAAWLTLHAAHGTSHVQVYPVTACLVREQQMDEACGTARSTSAPGLAHIGAGPSAVGRFSGGRGYRMLVVALMIQGVCVCQGSSPR